MKRQRRRNRGRGSGDHPERAGAAAAQRNRDKPTVTEQAEFKLNKRKIVKYLESSQWDTITICCLKSRMDCPGCVLGPGRTQQHRWAQCSSQNPQRTAPSEHRAPLPPREQPGPPHSRPPPEEETGMDTGDNSGTELSGDGEGRERSPRAPGRAGLPWRLHRARPR